MSTLQNKTGLVTPASKSAQSVGGWPILSDLSGTTTSEGRPILAHFARMGTSKDARDGAPRFTRLR